MSVFESFRLSAYRDEVVTVEARVDPDQAYLSVPSTLAERLHLKSLGDRDFIPRHSRESGNLVSSLRSYVGPIHLEGRGTATCCGALVDGEEVVVGWLPLSALVTTVSLPSVRSIEEKLDSRFRGNDGLGVH